MTTTKLYDVSAGNSFARLTLLSEQWTIYLQRQNEPYAVTQKK